MSLEGIQIRLNLKSLKAVFILFVNRGRGWDKYQFLVGAIMFMGVDLMNFRWKFLVGNKK